MIKRRALLWVVIFVHFTATAQEKRFLLKGIVYSSAAVPIENTHIVNATTKQGTVSNKNGEFSLFAKQGDWIQLSNVQFTSKKIKLKKAAAQEQFLSVYLIPLTNVLEEAVIKKKLKGVLVFDRRGNTKDTIPKIDKAYYNFSNMDLSIKGVKNLQDKSNAQYHTDPTMKNVAVSIVSVSIPDRSSQKKQAKRKEANFKENLPIHLKKLFGENFFSVKLKIPKDRYYHFLAYCSQFGIAQLFKDQNHLEILKILLKESKSYLLLLENNK